LEGWMTRIIILLVFFTGTSGMANAQTKKNVAHEIGAAGYSIAYEEPANSREFHITITTKDKLTAEQKAALKKILVVRQRHGGICLLHPCSKDGSGWNVFAYLTGPKVTEQSVQYISLRLDYKEVIDEIESVVRPK
jgi:hypothetical protein